MPKWPFAAMLTICATFALAQDTRSFMGESSLGRAAACQAAKEKAELFNYLRTSSCSCSQTSAGTWQCQVDASKS